MSISVNVLTVSVLDQCISRALTDNTYMYRNRPVQGILTQKLAVVAAHICTHFASGHCVVWVPCHGERLSCILWSILTESASHHVGLFPNIRTLESRMGPKPIVMGKYSYTCIWQPVVHVNEDAPKTPSCRYGQPVSLQRRRITSNGNHMPHIVARNDDTIDSSDWDGAPFVTQKILLFVRFWDECRT